jgi:DNA-binding transcriptional regulator YdaS (Cro superfamily)
MDPRAALKKAVERAGGQTALGQRIGVKQTTVRYWLTESKKGVPAQYAPAIERVTGVQRHELRPDVYPSPLPPQPGDPAGGDTTPSRKGHFSRYRHLRRDRFKSAEDVEEYIRALREEWSHR